MKKSFRKLLSVCMCLVFALSLITVTPSSSVTVEAATSTPVASHGQLSVNGTQLVDQSGQAFQIRGVSTHGLQWDVGYNYNNQAAFQTVRDDWGANCIRLAMYVGEGGYLSNPEGMKAQVNNGVSYATNLGMYAIIDWHILNGDTANPLNYTSQAISFFDEMSKRYKDYNNIIYEICNEPNNCSWDDIKRYAEQVIPVIRRNDSDAVIIVGTPTWSQLGTQGHTYEPADNPITGYSNIMYAFHFYASDASHNQWLTAKIGTAISRGLPVFVSEFGLSEASGNGNVDTSKATEWLNRCDQYKVSYCAWSLCNKNESSALISSGCSKTSGWSASELSTAGQFIRNWYRQKQQDENPLINNPEVKNKAKDVSVSYRTHVQTYAWQSYVSDGKMSGTSGQAKRLEAIQIKLNTSSGIDLHVQYKTHVQTYGWQDWVSDDAVSGTSGQAKRLEAIAIKLTGNDADKYDIYYRVHAQTYGWLDWAKNGQFAGTEGLAKRLEAINIVIVPKGADPGVSTTTPFITPYGGTVNYRTHVQTYGWQNYVADGSISGTSAQAKRLEGINIKLNSQIDGGIRYMTHVQSYGWQDWKYDGEMSGTEGQAKRLEAIKIELTGAVKDKYDVYYRVHSQTYGWLDWACNGQMAGTSGLSKRLEAIQIVLVPKGGAAPGATTTPAIIGQ